MNFLAGFKKVTHVLAVAGVAVVGFITSDAGLALIKQYPKLSGIAGIIGILGALYSSPKSS